MFNFTVNRVLGMTVVLAVSAGAGWAQEKVVLKVADIFPNTHYIANQGAQVWMEKATELSGGRIEFEYYPAQQLGKAKDILSLVQSGVTDIGGVAPAYVPETLPLSAVGELPGMFDTACEGSAAFASLATNGGFLDEQEFSSNNVRVLLSNMLAPYTVHTSGSVISSYEDLEGLKIYASGNAKQKTLAALGAAAVQMSAAESYQSLERGTIDGVMLGYIALPPYGLDELVKNGISGVNLGSTTMTYVINEDVWTELDPDIQDALTEAGKIAGEVLCSYSDTENGKVKAALEGKGGNFHALEGEEAETVLGKIAPVIDEWSQELEAQGKPGQQAVTAFRDAVSAQN